MKKIIIQLILSCLCIIANTQTRISGYITDKDSVPLAGAFVFIPESNKGTISDKNGYYELKNIPNGEIKMQFSFVGYTNIIKSLITTDIDISLNVKMEESILEAEEIIVTGGYNSTQHENAVKIDVLKMKLSEIKTTPNFMETITKIPGVDMISKGNGVSKPVIRGLSMNDILVLNNGVRFENYQYSSHHPLGIDEFGIEDVEVIKGPASLLYGSDAIGGVMNFIKEKPAPENYLTSDYNLQLFSNSLGMINNLGIKAASSHFFAGIRAGQKSNADYLQGGGDYVPNTRFNEYSIKTNAGYTGTTGSFRIFYDFSRQNLGLAEKESVEQISERGRQCRLFYQQLNTHLISSQNKLYLGNFKLDANMAFQKTELIHFGEVNIYEIQMRLATLTYETKLYLPSDEKSEYILGFQGMHQENSNIRNRETILLPDANINNYSAFVLLQRTFFNNLKLQTGVRYDYRTIESEPIGTSEDTLFYRSAIDKEYGSLSCSLGATYSLSDQLLLRVNIATAYRTPNLAELTSKGQHETRYEIGDQLLNPERSYEGDLSLHYHQRYLAIDLAGFYNTVNQFIFIAPTGDTSASGVNIYRYKQNDARLCGFEADLHIHPPFVNWLHFESTFSSVIGKQKNRKYLPFIPAKKLKTEIRVENEKFSFLHDAYVSLSTDAVFKQNNIAPDETSTQGYFLVDISVGGDIKWTNQFLSFSFNIYNVFDKKYIDHLSTLKEVDFYNPGRNFALTMKVLFNAKIK
jgi:iron complex outermembrane recepter protein